MTPLSTDFRPALPPQMHDHRGCPLHRGAAQHVEVVGGGATDGHFLCFDGPRPEVGAVVPVGGYAFTIKRAWGDVVALEID